MNRWRDRRDDFAVVWWLLHRKKVAFAAAYYVDGDTHAERDGFGLAVGFLFDHRTAARLSWQQLRRALGSHGV